METGKDRIVLGLADLPNDGCMRGIGIQPPFPLATSSALSIADCPAPYHAIASSRASKSSIILRSRPISASALTARVCICS